MKSWLDRCESVCCPDSDLLCADKVKLRNERLNVQVNYIFYSVIFFSMYEFYFLFTLCNIFNIALHNLVLHNFACTGNAEGDAVL